MEGLPCRSQDKKRAKYTLKHAFRSMYATPEVRTAAAPLCCLAPVTPWA